MSINHGFYFGVFYPTHSPLYNPGDNPTPNYIGSCFAPVGQVQDYKGFLFHAAELYSDYILYA